MRFSKKANPGLGERTSAIRDMTQQGRVAHLGAQAKPWGSIDSKLRRCDLVKMKIGDIVAGEDIRTRAIAIQQKTNRPVQFELTGDVRANVR